MDWRRYADRPDLVDFVALEVDGARALVRGGYEPYVRPLLGLNIHRDAERASGGRAAHPIVRIPGLEERVLIRGYRRGGLIRHVNGDRYFGGHRAFEEAAATELARRGGVNVPFVLAVAERPRGIGYTATLATRWIEGARDLPTWLAGQRDTTRKTVLRRVGEQIRRMHEAGLAHPDLNLRNLLVRADEQVVVLDFDRAGIHEGGATAALRARNLRRFGRSARKLGIVLTPVDWAELARGYGTGWPLSDVLR